MSRNPPEGIHVAGIFRDVGYWLGSIAPARPPGDRVPCLEDHRGPALSQRSSRERPFLFHDSSAVSGEMCRAGKMLATASR